MLITGRPEEAIAEIERALESDPLKISYNRSLALSMFVARREADAVRQCVRSLKLEACSRALGIPARRKRFF